MRVAARSLGEKRDLQATSVSFREIISHLIAANWGKSEGVESHSGAVRGAEALFRAKLRDTWPTILPPQCTFLGGERWGVGSWVRLRLFINPNGELATL